MGSAAKSTKQLDRALQDLQKGNLAWWDQLYKNMGTIDREVAKITKDIDLGIDVDKLAMEEFGGIGEQVLEDMRKGQEAAAKAAEEHAAKLQKIGDTLGALSGLFGALEDAAAGLDGAFGQSASQMLGGLSGLTSAAQQFTSAMAQPPPMGWIGMATAAIQGLGPLKDFLLGLEASVTGLADAIFGGQWGHGSMGAKGSSLGTAGEVVGGTYTGSGGHGIPPAGAGPPSQRPPGYPADMPWPPPAYAGGSRGLVSSPTFAHIAERGPEAVLTVPQLNNLVALASSSSFRPGGGAGMDPGALAAAVAVAVREQLAGMAVNIDGRRAGEMLVDGALASGSATQKLKTAISTGSRSG